ncbi:unnamed protein product, partial [Rotaria sordida]
RFKEIIAVADEDFEQVPSSLLNCLKKVNATP